MHTIHVRFFARFRDMMGADGLDVCLPDGARVRDLRIQLSESRPQMASLLQHSQVAVDNEFASDDMLFRPGDEVALIPPVSGG